MYKVKDQEEAVKNAKLFYETVKLAWGLQVTYCCHDLIHMIKNNLCYDLYDSDNGWGMGLGAKDQNDADVCALAEILKDEDEESEEKEEFIQHYAQNYSSLKKALKFKETFSEVKPKLLRKALRFTSNLPGDLHTPAEYVEQVEYFTQQIKKNLILNMVQIYIMKGWKF